MDFIDRDQELLKASVDLLKCIEHSFNYDSDCTENVETDVIFRALLGLPLEEGEICNLVRLSEGIKRFQAAVALAGTIKLP